jgi:hypothetical protein
MQAVLWSIRQADDCWIGICDSLKLTVESGSRGELLEDIFEATETAVRSLELAGAGPSRPLRLHFDIPFMLAAANAADPATATHR